MFKPAYLMGVVAAAIVGAIFAQTPPSPLPNPEPVPPPAAQIKERLPKFQSCQDLRGKLQKFNNGPMENYRLDSMGPSQSKEFSPSAAPNYSPTNVQVTGVDEGDLVKTDGRFLYTFSNEHLTITGAVPPQDADVISSTDLQGLQPREMLLDGERLILLGQRTLPAERSWNPSDSWSMRPSIEPILRPSQRIAVAELWDVSDPKQPERIRMTAWRGTFLTSRATEGFAYLAIQTHVDPSEQEPVPMFQDQIQDAENLENDNGFQPVADCKNIAYVDPIQSATFVTVASFPFHSASRALDQSVVLARGEIVYASLEHFYLAETSYGDWRENSGPKTTVVQFAFDRGNVRARGAVHVAGRTLNQFSMDEHDGVFRIVTMREPRNGQDMRATDLYLLDENLERLGAVENIAPGEHFYAARFFGDRAYLVTFQVTDPLFVVDLSDPKNPKVLGELEIPGYSTYLQLYDDTHLIGIGRNVSENGADNGLKFALFDVADPAHPKTLHSETIGDRTTTSPTLTDHKALLFDREKALFVLPISMSDIIWEDSAREIAPMPPKRSKTFQGVAVYRLTLENGFELQTQITHETDPSYPSRTFYPNAQNTIQRALWIDDALYTISDRQIAIHDLADLREIKRVELSQETPIPYIYPLSE